MLGHTVKMSPGDISFAGEEQNQLIKAVLAGEPKEKLARIIEKKQEEYYRNSEHKNCLRYQDSLGNTAAHYALLKRRSPEVLELLEVNINIENKMGLTPKDLILYSRWRMADGSYTRLYPEPVEQERVESLLRSALVAEDDEISFCSIPGIFIFLLSFLVVRLSYKRKLAPAKKVFIRISDLVLYIPVFMLLINLFNRDNELFSIGIMQQYYITLVEYMVISWILIMPVMFYYHAGLPYNRKI